MPTWTLLIWVPLALLAAYKMVHHERAAAANPTKMPLERTLQWGMIIPIGAVAVIAFIALFASAFK